MNYSNGKRVNLKNQIQGKKNKVIGQWFEAYIQAACAHYSKTGVAVIEKIPEPMRPIKNLGKGQFTAVFEKKAQPDFKGVVFGGQSIIFEAKHTDSDQIKQDRVSEEQANSLTLHLVMGSECYVLVSMKMQDFYFVPWRVWRTMGERFGRKYMTEADLKPYQVHVVDGVVRFLDNLEAVKQHENYINN